MRDRKGIPSRRVLVFDNNGNPSYRLYVIFRKIAIKNILNSIL